MSMWHANVLLHSLPLLLLLLLLLPDCINPVRVECKDFWLKSLSRRCIPWIVYTGPLLGNLARTFQCKTNRNGMKEFSGVGSIQYSP